MKRTTDEERAKIRAKLAEPAEPPGFAGMWRLCQSFIAGLAASNAGLSADWMVLDAFDRKMRKQLTAWQSETILHMARAWIKGASAPAKGQA